MRIWRILWGRGVLLLCAAMLSAALVACGGPDDGSEAATEPPAAPTTAAPATATSQETPTPAETPSPTMAVSSETPTQQAAPSPATGVLQLTGGRTDIDFDDDDDLEDAGVTIGAVDPARQTDSDDVELPITGGEFDSQALRGTIEHDGGIEFATSAGSVQVTEIVVDLNAQEITGMVDGQRIVLFTLDLSDIDRDDDDDPDYSFEVDDIDGYMSPDAASLLNERLGVSVFGPQTEVDLELKLRT